MHRNGRVFGSTKGKGDFLFLLFLCVRRRRGLTERGSEEGGATISEPCVRTAQIKSQGSVVPLKNIVLIINLKNPFRSEARKGDERTVHVVV